MEEIALKSMLQFKPDIFEKCFSSDSKETTERQTTVSLGTNIANLQNAHMAKKQLTENHMFPLKAIKVSHEYAVRNGKKCISTQLGG